MLKEFSATRVKNNFGEILDLVYAGKHHVLVKKSNKPVALIVPLSDAISTPGKYHLSDEEVGIIRDGMSEFSNSFDFQIK